MTECETAMCAFPSLELDVNFVYSFPNPHILVFLLPIQPF